MAGRTSDFVAGGISGWTQAFSTRRVGLILGGGMANHRTELTMTPTEARSVANALYEMADAAENVIGETGLGGGEATS